MPFSALLLTSATTSAARHVSKSDLSIRHGLRYADTLQIGFMGAKPRQPIFKCHMEHAVQVRCELLLPPFSAFHRLPCPSLLVSSSSVTRRARRRAQNVRARLQPWNPIAITGPIVLRQCYDEGHRTEEITFIDAGPPSHQILRAVGSAKRVPVADQSGRRWASPSERPADHWFAMAAKGKAYIYSPTCKL